MQRGEPEGRDDSRNCVWMRAGLVTYKLCDRDFDCDRCPLDAGLRGQPYAVPAGPRTKRLPRWHFPGDRSYVARHLWLREAGDVLRVGLDEFAAGLLAMVRDVALVPAGSRLGRGDLVGEILCAGGTVKVPAPLSGSVTRTNPALRTAPDRLVSDPYHAGWLLELQAERPDERAHLLSSAAIRKRLESDVRRLQRRVAMLLLTGDDALGPRMADGGELLVDLRRILGDDRYIELISDLLT